MTVHHNIKIRDRLDKCLLGIRDKSMYTLQPVKDCERLLRTEFGAKTVFDCLLCPPLVHLSSNPFPKGSLPFRFC